MRDGVRQRSTKKNVSPPEKWPVRVDAQFLGDFCRRLKRQKSVSSLGGRGVSSAVRERRWSPPNSSQDACVCASVRAQPTGAPLLSITVSRERVPAFPPHATTNYHHLIRDGERCPSSFNNVVPAQIAAAAPAKGIFIPKEQHARFHNHLSLWVFVMVFKNKIGP